MIESETKPRSTLLWALSTGIIATVMALLLQSHHGFYRSDLGADPDEPAHAVTSLMVRDYLADGIGQNPLTFAKDYYARYPKVALGHYPPMYYLVAGVWLLPWRSIAALGVLQAMQLGLLATTTMWMLRRKLPGWIAASITLASCAMPFITKLSVMVMSDLQLALLCLWSALAWQRFMETRRPLWSLAFGLLAAAAILTKGSAWSLALLPGLSILFTRDWRLLSDWRTWIATAPVALFALPWQLWSSKITAHGMTGMTPSQHFSAAVPFYAETLPNVLGPVIVALMTVALLIHLVRWCYGRRMDTGTAVLWALVIATMIIVLAIPAGLTSRYLMPLFFPVLILLVGEMQKGLRWAEASRITHIVSKGAVATATLFTLPSTYDKEVVGFSQAITAIIKQSANDGDLRLLAESDARGEGALVAAAAFTPADGSRRISVLRGSKELADQDWMGRDYKLRATTEASTLHVLAEQKVDWVMFDDSVPPGQSTQAHALLAQALQSPGSGWEVARSELVHRMPGASGYLKLYHRSNTAASAQLSTPHAP